MADMVVACTNESDVILDLGSGREPLSRLLPRTNVITMDVNKDVHPTIVCDFTAGIPLHDNSVDCIVAGEILEHLTSARAFVTEMRRVIAHSGSVVLSVPNITSAKYRLAWLVGRVPAHAAKADYTYPPQHPAYPRGHVRDYNFRELRRALGDCGFRVVDERGIGLFISGNRVISPRVLPTVLSDQAIIRAVAV
jgi:predicted SAM-dependent methyltransferase